MNNFKAIYAVLAMLTIWCSWNSANIGKNTNNMDDIYREQQLIDRAVNDMIESLEAKKQLEEVIPTESFNDVFKEMRSIHGPGYVFTWNGEEYTTDYAEELNIFATIIDGSKWVLNANDLDDFCRSNYHDECGVCDGHGALTWYLDRDGDGLGDGSRIQLSCNEPIANK